MHSAPLDLGRQAADASGRVTFTWTVPADTTPGLHTVEFAGETSGSVSAQFTVTAPAQAAPGGLVGTGASVAAPLVLAGILLVAGGIGLLSGRRQRRFA